MNVKLLGKVTIICVTIAVAFVIIHGNSHSADPATDVASLANASECRQSYYQMSNNYGDDQSLHTIYNCKLRSGRVVCVTVYNNIAYDETSDAADSFANTLGNKPNCLIGRL